MYEEQRGGGSAPSLIPSPFHFLGMKLVTTFPVELDTQGKERVIKMFRGWGVCVRGTVVEILGMSFLELG